MRFTIISVLLLGFPLFVNSQINAELNLKTLVEDENKYPHLIFVGKNSKGGFLIVKEERTLAVNGKYDNAYYIELRDQSLEHIQSKKISDFWDPQNSKKLGYSQVGNSIVVFVKTASATRDGFFDIYTQTLDMNSLEISPKKIIAKELDMIKLGNTSSVWNKNQYVAEAFITNSRNGNSHGVMIFHANGIKCISMDKELNVRWEQDVESLSEERSFSDIDEDGNIFVVGKKEQTLRLYRIDENGLNTELFDPKLDRNVNYSLFSLDAKGDIVLAGTVELNNPEGMGAYGAIEGINVLKFSGEKLQLVNNTSSTFDQSFIKYGRDAGTYEKDLKKADKKGYKIGVKNLRLNKIKFDSNNDIYLLGEQVGFSSYSSISIVAVKFKSSGEHQYNCKLPRSHYPDVQTAPLKRYSTYFTDNELNVVFLDNKNNTSLNFAEKIYTSYSTSAADNVFVSSNISNDGRETREVAVNMEKEVEGTYYVMGWVSLSDMSDSIANNLDDVLLLYRGKNNPYSIINLTID